MKARPSKWSQSCDGCTNEPSVVAVGEPEAYGNHTIYLCLACSQEAFDVARAEHRRRNPPRLDLTRHAQPLPLGDIDEHQPDGDET